MGFAQNLKFLMETEGLTKYRLAKEINISQTSLANWLEEKNIPHPSTLNILASYFEISVNELVGEKLPPVRKKEQGTGSPITSKIDAILSFNRISKTDFLKACNISSDSYAKWDSGETMPTVNDLVRIAGYLHVTLGYLLEPEEEQKKEALSLDGKELTGVEGALVKLFRQIPVEKQSALLDSIEMTLRMQGLL